MLKGDGHEYGVDLRDGHFEKDGTEINMSDGDGNEHKVHDVMDFKLDELGNQIEAPEENKAVANGAYRLIFWREHTHDFEVGKTTDTETKHEIVYRMGCSAPWAEKTIRK